MPVALNGGCGMASDGLEIADIALRLIGAFYAFAGYVATRAGLTSYFIDRAIAAIALKKQTAPETAQTAWLLSAAVLVLIGGVLLMLQMDLAAWAFAASSLAQVAYLFLAAARACRGNRRGPCGAHYLVIGEGAGIEPVATVGFGKRQWCARSIADPTRQGHGRLRLPSAVDAGRGPVRRLRP